MPRIVVPRVFSEINGDDRRGPQSPYPLAHFFGRAAFVVLGEPGMGKTTALKKAAIAEPTAVYVTVRQFLSTPLERWRGRTLYLDALDETRARTVDSASVTDRLVERLGALGCPKFRLSCRAADWEGGSDKAALQDASADGGITLLRLEPLSDDDVLAITGHRLPDPNAFARKAEARGLDTLLRNPQTLDLLLQVVADGGWPATRKELFEQACRLLLRETNEQHTRAVGDQLPATDIERAAGYLATVHLLSDAEGFALTRAEASPDYPAIQDLHEAPTSLTAAARRRMFEAIGSERVAPPHRTISEFMAARYLRDRLRDRGGLPLGRVLALITGFDGGTLSDLRGVYAWLVSLCPEHADQLLEIDPIAAVLYGDASLWTLSTKRRALDCTRRLAETDPYFRAHQWSGEPFGALADPELVPDLVAALTATRHYHLLSTVLDIVRHGPPLPDLGDALLSVARDEGTDDLLRSEAIAAFAHACPARRDELRALLDAVHDGAVPDQQKLLRTALLKRLYPGVLTPIELVSYLVPSGDENYATYGWYLSHNLPQVVPDDHLPDLADALAERGAPKGTRPTSSWSDLAGETLRRLLLRPEAADPARLYRWLGMAVTEDEYQILDPEHQEVIRRHLSSNGDLHKAMFRRWAREIVTNRLWLEWRDFHVRLCHPPLPSDFGAWLLSEAGASDSAEVAKSLFELACSLSLHHPTPEPGATDILFGFAENHPECAEVLSRRSFCPVYDWRLESAQRRIERNAKQQARRDRNVRELERRLAAIRRGDAIDVLVRFAVVWFGRFVDLDRDVEPFERLVSETNEEIASALRDGFVALLHRPGLPQSPAEIAQLELQGQQLMISEAVLAGLDIVAARSQEDLLALPDPALACGLCLELVVPAPGERAWPSWVRANRPDLAHDALLGFWRPLLGAGIEHVPGIHQLRESDPFPSAPAIVLTLLREFPDAADGPLKMLLSAALGRCDAGAVVRLASEILGSSDNRLSERARLRWTIAAFLFSPEQHRGALVELTANSADAVKQLFLSLKPCWGALAGTNPVDHRLLEPLIAVLGGTYDNVLDIRPGGLVGEAAPENVARFIRQLIDRLSGDATEPASEALLRLAARAMVKFGV